MEASGTGRRSQRATHGHRARHRGQPGACLTTRGARGTSEPYRWRRPSTPAHAWSGESPRARSSWTQLSVAAPYRDAGLQRRTLDALAGGGSSASWRARASSAWSTCVAFSHIDHRHPRGSRSGRASNRQTTALAIRANRGGQTDYRHRPRYRIARRATRRERQRRSEALTGTIGARRAWTASMISPWR